MQIISIDPHTHAITIFGIPLLGASADTLHKLFLSVGFILALWLVFKLLRLTLHAAFQGFSNRRLRFWIRQGLHLVTAVLVVVGLLSIWFDDPGRMATFAGLVTAGLAFALQRVITAFAGYCLILRGKTFNVGDRISMGGVRGDVMDLGFLQTTIMEMGQPPSVQTADPAMWVHSRQYSGRIVTVTNAKIFDDPVYNYTRDFPFIWEELTLPVKYGSDWQKAEQIFLDAAHRHTEEIKKLGESDLAKLERRFNLRRSQLEPRVYLRLTDNWIELTVRFLVKDHAIRDVKDAMYRQILQAFAEAKLEVASGTYEIVGLPPIQLQTPAPPPPPAT